VSAPASKVRVGAPPPSSRAFAIFCSLNACPLQHVAVRPRDLGLPVGSDEPLVK
jgi:hypothetical protein